MKKRIFLVSDHSRRFLLQHIISGDVEELKAGEAIIELGCAGRHKTLCVWARGQAYLVPAITRWDTFVADRDYR